MKDNLVSVIMPVYNCEKHIEEAVNSVINQTYFQWELILVDDCSTDNSLRLISNYKNKDNRIKIIKLNENSGAAVARNKAIESSKGRFIAFLDCDDIWKKEKLKNQIKYMLDNDVAFSYSNYEIIMEDGRKINKIIKSPNNLNYKNMLKGNSIGCLTVIIDREKAGNFKMPLLRKGQDYATWLNLMKKGFTAYNINENLALYRRSKHSLSSSMASSLKRTWHIYYNVEKLGLLKSVYYFNIYMIRALKKRII